MKLVALALSLLAATVWCACAGKRISDIDEPASPSPAPSGPYWVVPPGVVVPANQRGAIEVDGLYPSTDPNERCCWIAPHATLVVTKPVGASTAVLTVFVPDYPFFETHPPRLTVNSSNAQSYAGLDPGVHRLSIQLPDTARTRSAENLALPLRVDRAFVPADQGINSDKRALGIIVLGVGFDEPAQGRK